MFIMYVAIVSVCAWADVCACFLSLYTHYQFVFTLSVCVHIFSVYVPIVVVSVELFNVFSFYLQCVNTHYLCECV